MDSQCDFRRNWQQIYIVLACFAWLRGWDLDLCGLDLYVRSLGFAWSRADFAVHLFH